MKKFSIYLLLLICIVVSQGQGCGNNSGCKEKNAVTHEDVTSSSVRVVWSHNCMQCSSWEVGKKKKVLGLYPLWYSWSATSTSINQTGSSFLFTGLDPGKKYRFKVKSKSGDVCVNGKNIGTTDAETD